MIAMGSADCSCRRCSCPRRRSTAARTSRTSTFPVRLNLGFSNAYRAPGVMEGSFGFEQVIDELAEALDLDPLELRRRNCVDVDQASGLPYSSKGLAARDRARGRAGRLGGSPRACQRPIAGRPGARPRGRLPDLVGRRRSARARARPPRCRRSRDRRHGHAGHRHGHHDRARAGRGRGARALARPGPRRDGHDALRRLSRRSPAARRRLASMAPAVRAAANDVRGQVLDLASDLFEVDAPTTSLLADGEISEP